MFISEEWLKSEFCRGELIALQEVVKINPELEVIFVILASPRVAVDKKTISDKSFPVEWKEFLQPRDGSQDEQDFDVIAWANSQLQLLSEKKAAGGNTAAGKSTIAGRQTSREVRQYENERLENDGKCSKCKNIYKSHEITSWPNINGKNGKWHCRGCILTNIGNVKKSAKARDGWRPKLGHLELLAKRYGEEVQKIEQKCGGVYDMHYVWEWCVSSMCKFVSHALRMCLSQKWRESASGESEAGACVAGSSLEGYVKLICARCPPRSSGTSLSWADALLP